MHWLFYLTVLVALSDIIIIISSFKKVFKSENRQPVAALFLENPRMQHIVNRSNIKLHSLKKLIKKLPDNVDRELGEEYLEVSLSTILLYYIFEIVER